MTRVLLEKVPYLEVAEIEREANRLLAEADAAGVRAVEQRTPIDAIIETVLRLTVEIDDLGSRFADAPAVGFGETLGAIDLDGGAIWVDERIDPTRGAVARHRYNFTLGHEAAHWWLHRNLSFRPDQDELNLQGGKGQAVSGVCRGLDRPGHHPPVEWQANQYAAFLLMPRERIRKAWARRFNSDRPRTFADDRHQPEVQQALERARSRRAPGAEPQGNCEIYFDYIASQFNVGFDVSRQAMAIQLQTLGLLLEAPETQLSLW